MRVLVAYICSLLVLAPTPRAAEYFVDKNAPGASDSNLGAEDDPWETIQKGADVAVAGDTVYVKAGVYYEWVDVKNTGTVGAPIVFAAYPGDEPVIDGTGVNVPDWHALFYADEKSHIVIDGFEIRSVDSATVYLIRINSGEDVTVRNCVVHGNNLGDVCYSPTSGACSSGLFFGECNGGLIENNEVYDTGRNAIHLSDSNNITIRRNYVHDNPHHNAVNNFPKTTEPQTVHRGNNIEYNILTGSTGGVYLRYEAENVIHDNLIFGNLHSGIMLAPASASGVENYVYRADTKIYNNTIIGNGGNGIQSSNGTHFTIKNNIIADNGGAYSIYINSSAGSGHAIDNNLYHPSVRFGHAGSDYTSLGSWQSSTGFGASSLVAEPGFADAAGADFSLTAGSEAIDRGLDLSGEGVTQDIDGVPRPQGDGFDIGAYEYVDPGGEDGGTPDGGDDGSDADVRPDAGGDESADAAQDGGDLNDSGPDPEDDTPDVNGGCGCDAVYRPGSSQGGVGGPGSPPLLVVGVLLLLVSLRRRENPAGSE